MRVVRFQRNRKGPMYEIVVRFTCDHCGKEIEPGQNGMLCWKANGNEFKILHGGYCTPYYDHLPKSVPLKYVSITEMS